MPKSNESFNKDLYGFLQAQNFGRILTQDDSGSDVPKAEDADQFIFHYKFGDKDYGTVVVTTHGGTVKVFYNKTALKSQGGDNNWAKFLAKLKDFSLRHGQMRFQPEDLAKIGDEMTRRKQEKKEEKLLEGYYGTKHTSYSDSTPPNIKMIIKHSKPLEETDARFRFVEKIFLETERGERLLLNTKKPSVGRIYARHLAEGGEYNDDRWKHINEISEEISKLGGFIRATRNRQFNESVSTIISEVYSYYGNLRETVKKLQGSRGYHQYFESWKPTLLEQDEDANYSDMFVSSSLDPRIEAALPILNKLNFKFNELNEANEFENWANNVVEGLSAGEDAKVEKLVKLLQAPKVPVGPDASIIHTLQDVIEKQDDLKSIRAELEKISKNDPDFDAKPILISFLQKNSNDKFYDEVLDKLDTVDVAPAQPVSVAPAAKPAAPATPAKAAAPAAPGAAPAAPSPEDIKKADSLMPVTEEQLDEKENKKPAQRNFVAKHAQKSGAGVHGKKGYQRHDKHKKKLKEDDFESTPAGKYDESVIQALQMIDKKLSQAGKNLDGESIKIAVLDYALNMVGRDKRKTYEPYADMINSWDDAAEFLQTVISDAGQQDVMERMDPEKRARLDDLIDQFSDSVDPSDYASYLDPDEIIDTIRQEFGDRIADQVSSGADKMHFPRQGHSYHYDPLGWKKPVDRITKAGKMYKQDSDFRKNTIKSRYKLSGKSATESVEEGTLEESNFLQRLQKLSGVK